MVSPADFVFNKAPTAADFPRVSSDWVGNLPDDYWKGQQYGIQRRLQTMFADPNSDASKALRSGNYGAILGQVAQTGGYPAVAPMMPTMMGLGALQNVMQGAPDPDAPGVSQPGTGAPAPQAQPKGAVGNAPFAPTSAAASTNGAGPSNFSGNPATGSDNSGDTTVRSMIPGDRNVPQEILDRIATSVGARPSSGMSAADAPLTPAQADQAQQILRSRGAKLAGPMPTGETAANVGGGEQGGGPGPAGSSPNTPGGWDAVAQGQSAGQEGGFVPGDSSSQSQTLRRAQTEFAKRAESVSVINPKLGEQLRKRADDYGKRADEMDARIGERGKMQFGVGVEAAKEQNKLQIAADEKSYQGLNGKAREYEENLKPALTLTRSILNDPRAYTGAGAGRSLDINRIRAAFGDRNAAVLQEAMKKITASSVMDQLNNQRFDLDEAGIQGGRVFKQSADLVQQAAPALENTLAGNRFLVEVQTRTGELTTKIAELARQYKASHGGRLGPGFDAQLSQYTKEHPLYTKDELSHPELLGSPTAPRTINSRDAFDMWAKGVGLNRGDAYRTPDGKLKIYVPS